MHLPGGRWFAFFWNVMDFWQECTKMSWSDPNYNDLSFAALRLENLVPEMKMRQQQWKFMNQCLSLNGQGVDDDERDWSLSVPLGIFLSQCVSISGQCSSSWWWWRWWWWWWCWRKITWEHTILFSGNIKYRSQTIQKHLSFLIWNYLDCDSCDWRDTLAGLKRNLKNCWKYRWPRLKLKYCSAHGVNLRAERAVHESWVHRQSTLHHPQLPSPPWFSVLVHIISFCLVIINDSSSCHAVIMSPYYHHQVIRSPGTKRGCVCWILGVAGSPHNDNHHRILIITRLGWWWSSHSRCLWWYDNLG